MKKTGKEIYLTNREREGRKCEKDYENWHTRNDKDSNYSLKMFHKTGQV